MEHFVFWGLFVAFFVIIFLYWIWMIRAERKGSDSNAGHPAEEGDRGSDGDR